jgi:Ankyrin repeats (3 copies)
MLIAAGARLNARNGDGNNALWLACVGDHLDVIDMLVEAGIDVDNRNDNGATPLMYAASSGKAGIVERLLVKGADPSPETLDGFTALDLAMPRAASPRGRGRKQGQAIEGTPGGGSGTELVSSPKQISMRLRRPALCRHAVISRRRDRHARPVGARAPLIE